MIKKIDDDSHPNEKNARTEKQHQNIDTIDNIERTMDNNKIST